MAGKPCGCALAQGRSSGSGNFDDVHSSLCSFSHAGHRDGGRYGWRIPQKSSNRAIRTKRAANAPQIKKDASGIKTHGQNFRGLKSNVRGTCKIAETGRHFLQNCRGSGRKGMHPCHRQYGGTEKYTVGCRFPLERTVQDMVEICRRLMNQPTYSIEEDCRCQRSSSFFRHERNKECGTKTKPSSGLSGSMNGAGPSFGKRRGIADSSPSNSFRIGSPECRTLHGNFSCIRCIRRMNSKENPDFPFHGNNSFLCGKMGR